MDKDTKFWAEGTAEEIGDLIGLVVYNYLDLDAEQVADAIGSKKGTVEAAIAGKNGHGFTILKKTCERFNLKFDILISAK